MRLPDVINIDEVQRAAMDGEHIGFCLNCGDAAWGVEPDAREYECNNCGERMVFGAEEILIMYT